MCARFDGSAIRRDVPGSFSARVTGASLPDCSDATLSDGTCGNGVVEGAEECDGGLCAGGTGYCGYPESVSECECCNQPCGFYAVCCPSEVFEPYPGGTGSCVPTRCHSYLDCRGGQSCDEAGLCCSNPTPDLTYPVGAICQYDVFYTLPCCAPAVCGLDYAGYYKLCCFEAGQPCTAASECCSNSCIAGLCN